MNTYFSLWLRIYRLIHSPILSRAYTIIVTFII